MKKVILVLIIVRCTFNIEDCLCQWQWVNPNINSYIVSKLKYADANTVYMAMEYGIIMKSTNKGNDWLNIYTDSTAAVGNLWFFNANTGFMISKKVNNSFHLLKTTNGGNNWNSFSVFNTYASPSSVQFVNTGTGYVCTYLNYYKTTNGGVSWDSMAVVSDSVFSLNNIYFINSNTGFITGVTGDQYQNYWGRIYKTTNGGVSWTFARTPKRPYTIQFFSDTGYVFCEPYLMKTFNLGTNWSTQYSNINHCSHSTKFSNSMTGIAVGGGNLTNDRVNISKTTNGGATWQQYTPVGFVDLYTIDGWGTNEFITGGQGGCVIKTTDGGLNWNSNSVITEGFFDISFPNSSVGYAVCKYSYLKTTNSGINWKADSIPHSYNLNQSKSSVKFFDSNTGFISKDSIYKTTNGGLNWITLNLGTNRNSPVFSFINENTGFALTTAFNYPVPNTSTIFIKKTTNGGNTWQETQLNQNIPYYFLYFANELTGYSCNNGSPNTLKKTTDGGVNWVNITTVTDFRKFYFVNSSKGFLFGNSGLFLTTNGGVNFNCVLLDSTMNGFDINFINNNTGYFIKHDYYANTRPKIYKTTNGGLNWNQNCYVFKNTRFEFIRFLDNNTGLCFGTPGTIIRTTNGGSFVNLIQIIEEVPTSFSLSQNYPNPFNPSTNIRYQIPILSSPHALGGDLVLLKIYDLLGKEVTTLVNEKQSPGTYEVTFDGSEYPSGVYFYQLSIDNVQFSIKKMVLIK